MELDTADSARASLALSMSSSAILAERSSCAGLPPSIFGNLTTGTVTHSLQITSLFRRRGGSGSKTESLEVSVIAFAQCCHDLFALVVEYSFQNPPNINRVRRLRDVRTDEMQLPGRSD